MVYVYVGNMCPSSGGPYSSMMGILDVFSDDLVVVVSKGNDCFDNYNTVSVGKLLKVLAKTDILHVQGFFGIREFILINYAALIKCKLIITPRGQFRLWALDNNCLFKRLFILLNWFALKNANVVVSSDLELSELPQFIENRSALNNLIPLKKLNLPKENIVLFIGRIVNSKGINSVLRVWPSIVKDFPGWRLLIGGPIEDDSIKIPSSLYLGELKSDEKWLWYSKSKIFVSPSSGENFGNTILEAWYCENLIICGRNTPWGHLDIKGIKCVDFDNDFQLDEAIRGFVTNEFTEKDSIDSFYNLSKLISEYRRLWNL